MIALFSETYNVTIHESAETELPHAQARINREATLDGDVAFEHNGVSHGDRSFRIRGPVTRAQLADLRAMHETETEVWCAVEEGTFLGAISKLKAPLGVLDLEFYVKQKCE